MVYNRHTPIDGVYKIEIMVEKKVCKKRKIKDQNVNHCRIDILKLEDVDILVYDFKFKKKVTLHSNTTNILTSLLAQEIAATLESAKPRRRSRRNMAYDILGTKLYYIIIWLIYIFIRSSISRKCSF